MTKIKKMACDVNTLEKTTPRRFVILATISKFFDANENGFLLTNYQRKSFLFAAKVFNHSLIRLFNHDISL